MKKIWVFWSAKRLHKSLDKHLMGDFSYIPRRPLGAMGVLHQEQNDGLPNHNFHGRYVPNINDLKYDTLV